MLAGHLPPTSCPRRPFIYSLTLFLPILDPTVGMCPLASVSQPLLLQTPKAAPHTLSPLSEPQLSAQLVDTTQGTGRETGCGLRGGCCREEAQDGVSGLAASPAGDLHKLTARGPGRALVVLTWEPGERQGWVHPVWLSPQPPGSLSPRQAGFHQPRGSL